MYLKRLKLVNYRKFSTEHNVIEFISSKLINNNKKKEVGISIENIDEVDIASDTTLIIGKNNAGKTTIITALDTLINKPSQIGANDFNYRYLQKYLSEYDINNPPVYAPFIEFVFTIELEENSSDRISNLIPFMLIEDLSDSELDICLRYEVMDFVSFKDEMSELLKNKKDEKAFLGFLELLNNTDFKINYYDKNNNKIDTDFKLDNLIEIKCIKANHLKNDHSLSNAFNKIIYYRYNKSFINEKKEIVAKLDGINSTLSNKISENHTDIIASAVKKLVSTDNLGIDLSANITFEKLMRDLIKYEYVEYNANIPEDQFGLGYTNLILIIAAIIDYIERYPETSFNSKINLISIEEPETFMHPQMQELFIKNINEAISVLLSRKNKNVNSQIIITTHSSHILNSKIQSVNSFNNISYLYEEKHNAAIKNLNNEKVQPLNNNKEKEKEKEFNFLKKHIKYKVSELFFADAAIFVEGYAEELLLPYYIEKKQKLNKKYISVFNISGAHAFVYKNLIRELGIPVLIITDLDIKRNDDDNSQVTALDKFETTNMTINDFLGTKDLSNIPNFKEIDNLYLAYQGEINGYYATSFEEALILTNYDNSIVNKVLKDIKPIIYKDIVGEKPNYKNNIINSYKWQMKLGNVKGEFASRMLYEIINEKKEKTPILPQYILDGLGWIEKKIGEE